MMIDHEWANENMPTLSADIKPECLIICRTNDCLHNNFTVCNLKCVTMLNSRCVNFESIEKRVPENARIEK
jgi:hypothetical protein